jgi:Family of unknown function (DUF6525)
MTKSRDMAAYDKLPPTARRALQESIFGWATQPIHRRWRDGERGYKTGSEIAARIAEWDKKHMRKLRR